MIYFTEEEFDSAACKSVGYEAFYEEDMTKRAHFKMLKTICSSCPITNRCLEVAIANDEKFGVWGGLTPEERHRLKRKPYRASVTHPHVQAQKVNAALKIRGDLERGYELLKNTLPANVKHLVELRLTDPTLSLEELGWRVSPSLRKNQVYGKLRTIAAKGREANGN